jgi:hypothetical protein
MGVESKSKHNRSANKPQTKKLIAVGVVCALVSAGIATLVTLAAVANNTGVSALESRLTKAIMGSSNLDSAVFSIGSNYKYSDDTVAKCMAKATVAVMTKDFVERNVDSNADGIISLMKAAWLDGSSVVLGDKLGLSAFNVTDDKLNNTVTLEAYGILNNCLHVTYENELSSK